MRLLSLLAPPLLLGCISKPSYRFQRTVPGPDGTVYVQAVKVQHAILFTSQSNVILKRKLRGEALRCDRELKIPIDNQYWQKPDYFQKQPEVKK
ncbi:MAG: hypothetical protein N2Z22_02645 [Turneriella sp.]|nr:hypothetical protein [Turneriella sp.]